MTSRLPRSAASRRSRRRSRRLLAGGAGAAALATAAVVVSIGVAAAAPGDATPPEITPTGGIAFSTALPPVPAGPGSTAERRVFALLNQQRSAHGLGALTWNANLARAALTHNRAMAAANTLSHQLPGEPDLGARLSAVGYTWRAAAENIGWNSQLDDAGALAIQGMFYDEQPPNDGHRLNILSTATSQVGVSVVVAGGRLWITEDFGAPR